MKAQPEPTRQEADDMRPINITVSPVIHLPDLKMPESMRLDIPAPIVNVAAPVVNVEKQDAPIVNVAAPIVNIEKADPQPAPIVNVTAPRATSQTQKVNRDEKGNIVSTTTTITYEGDR